MDWIIFPKKIKDLSVCVCGGGSFGGLPGLGQLVETLVLETPVLFFF